ncbi:28S ribosomal protein S18b, mitochondrial [Diabrotica virgifera virgifera]|uniref:Small ribosomal subunit protein mS40 n=1 Tax=Diabrotica virgifera virgifera TaxID=50390 RepID=A0A6P7EYR3_DIAVI|nr:28S ribosomal protein S18b, mitochondrial [Diabrotica virgifera virgifera]
MFSIPFLRQNLSLTKSNLPRNLFTSVVYQQSKEDQRVIETREITKDRTQQIPVETSIRYLKSAAYQQTYEGQPVWVLYRRNHKGLFPPRKTRKTCVRGGQISTGNPCPICRDEYLILHEQNVDLLKQFVSPQTGSILSYSKTGLCQKKHQQLIVAITRAYDRGLLTFDVPFRKYDYSEYYSEK